MLLGCAAFALALNQGNDAGRAAAILFALCLGAPFVALTFVLRRGAFRWTRPALFAALAAGALMRLAMVSAPPLHEDDWRRYLWDGAAVAAGIDPYAHPPAAGREVDAFGAPAGPAGDAAIARLRQLGATRPDYPEAVAYPHVKTIYPPLAQAAFAGAHAMAPFQLWAWRALLLGADAITLAMVLFGLRAAGQPAGWALLYWWNPAVLLFGLNAAHMDLLLGPALAGLLLGARAKRGAVAGLALAAAVGLKLWPLLLGPVVWASLREASGAARAFLFAAAGGSCAILAPQWIHLGEPGDGLSLYARAWERWSFLFPLLRDGLAALALPAEEGARLLVAAICGATALLMSSRLADRIDLHLRLMIPIVALLVVSPTGFPWYWIWVAPLAPFAPSLGLSLFTAGAALYLLRFRPEAAAVLAYLPALAVAPALGVWVSEAWSARTRRADV